MSLLNITFSYKSKLTTPLLLVEVTPFDILIGVKSPGSNTIFYECINPLPFKSLEDVVANFLNRYPEFQGIHSGMVALPLNFLEPQQNKLIPEPFKTWIFNLTAFKQATGLINVLFIDRAQAIGKAVPLLMASDFLVFSGQQASYFNIPKNIFMIAIADETYESAFLSFNTFSKKWESTQNLVHNLELNTHDEALQNILNLMGENVSFPYPTLTFFFSDKGIEKLYETLYQEKNMEEFLKQKLQLTPKVLQKGAPTDVDPVELNNTITWTSLEGLDISIASIEPRTPQKIRNASSFLPLSLKDSSSSSQDNLNWDELKTLPFKSIVNGAFSYKGLPSPFNISINSVPLDVEKLCFDCLDVWSKLLGETLGGQALLLNAKGGVFLSGRLLILIKNLLGELSLNSVFEKQIADQTSFTETSFALIVNPAPAFLGLISFFEEQ